MNKLLTSFIIVFLMCCTNLLAAEDTSSGTGPLTAVKQARDEVLSYFNPVSGTVSGISENTVTVKFRKEANVIKGMRFTVFRQGNPFYHPVTNELIGYTEDSVGRLEATGGNVGEGLYLCTIIRGNIKEMDMVRITSTKIKLAFFQERSSEWAASEAFYGSLKDSDRFEILDAYTSSYSPEDLSKLARDLNAEAVLLFSTPVKTEKRLISVKTYWAEDAKLFAEIEEETGQGPVNIFTPEEKFISSSLAEREPWRSYHLSDGLLFAMGDVDGNGNAELVVSDGNSISVYNFNEELQQTWSIKGGSGEKHVSIDILDLNNNGRAEVFVTSISGGDTSIRTDDGMMSKINTGDLSIRSYVLEYDPAEGYRKIKDNMPYFFRVSGKTLLMQQFGGTRAFSNPVYEGEWNDGDYHKKKKLVLPADVNIYGFAFVDWMEKGQSQTVTFDDQGYLILYDINGHAIWRSSRTYGKFQQSFETETHSVVNPARKWYIRGRLMPVRTLRGMEIIVVNKMPFLSKVPGLGTKGAEVYSLWWDGSDMDEKLILSEVSGSITDYWVEGKKLFLIARGDLLSFVKNAFTGELSKGSVLYYYNFGEK